MPENPIKGYTSRQQDATKLDATVGGAGTSGNPEEFKDDAAFRTSDASNNPKADGDNPSISSSVAFANGKDNRVGH